MYLNFFWKKSVVDLAMKFTGVFFNPFCGISNSFKCTNSELFMSLCPPDGVKFYLETDFDPASFLKKLPNPFLSIYSSPMAFDYNLLKQA